MNKLARVSLVLAGAVVFPAVFAGACGGDDSSGSGGSGGSTGGSAGSTGGSAGSGGATGGTGGATGGSAGSATGGAAGTTGGAGGATGGSAGSATGGAAGTTGGTGGKAGAAGSVGGASGSGGAAGKAGSSGMGGTAGGAPDGSAGTGGTAGGMPEAGRDGTTDADASTGDSGLNTCNTAGPALGLTCDDYCSTFITVCKPIPLWMNTYADKAACMSACASLNQAALCCRAQHVNLARDADGGADISMHCGHSTGMSPCT